MKQILIKAIIALFILVALWTLFHMKRPGIKVIYEKQSIPSAVFAYHCVDTMKVSRDKARLLEKDPKADEIITNQVHIAAGLGANCIAIGTPYDEEFQPYMKKWIAAARKASLSVWFRGNWSAWEGWFSYEKDLSPHEHIQKTIAFIRTHPELFEDGDIFSPTIEPENGAPFHPEATSSKKQALQSFLAEEQRQAADAFRSLGKDVTTEWISMSGGVAKAVIDKKTADTLNNTVTLDHYVSAPEGITEYINFFHESLQSQIVFGEFGAPIPDINGEMTENEQAEFIDSILWEMFLNRKTIAGINYWTLTESSTSLVDEEGKERKAAEVLRKYYIPGIVKISVTDNHGNPMKNVIITVKHDEVVDKTDTKGHASVPMPQGNYTIKLRTTTGRMLEMPITVKGNAGITLNAVF